jgi:COX assembly protein 1
LTLAFACRGTRRAMNGCMKVHSTQDEEDAAREEWFATRLERQREREKKTRRKLEQEAFIKEWWGVGGEQELEEKRKREEAKMGLAERVGGLSTGGGRTAAKGVGVAASRRVGTESEPIRKPRMAGQDTATQEPSRRLDGSR